jgi:hypothetical protein
MEIKAIAAFNPIVLGDSFAQNIRDTWIRSAPPAEQRVPWVFVSPTGMIDTVFATYREPHRWEIRYLPNELGRWRYHWTNDFVPDVRYRSPEGVFDVLIGERENAAARLADFLASVRANQGDTTESTKQRFMVQFMRLERAVIQQQTPASYRSAEGERMRATLNEIRGLLGGEPVPSPIPLVADAPPVYPAPPKVDSAGFIRRLIRRVRGS